MIDFLPIGIILSTVISLVFTVYLVNRASKGTKNTLESLGTQLTQGIQDINTQLEPIILTNSRSMGVISRLGDDGKMEKALDRRIGVDIIAQNEDVLEVIKLAFPNVSEYIEEHPEAITKLMPRIQQFLQDPEARKRLNLNTGSNEDLSRFWE